MAIATLTVDLVAKLATLERDMGKAAQIAERNAKRMEEAFSGVKTALAGLGAALSVGAFATMVRGVSDAGDELAKMSIRTGIAVEELSKLQYAASLSDVSNEDLATSLGRLNRVLGEAADGSKEATAALARFGIAPGTLNASEAFNQIADRVKNTSDQTKIASAMNDIFGKSWATLVPMIKNGSDGLKEAGDELERMGGVMSTDLAEASERFNDNITRLATQLEALKIQALGPLIPLFEELTKSMSETSGQANSLAEITGSGLKTAFEAITVFGANVAYVFKQAGNELGGMAAQLSALARGDFKGFSAIGEMMKADAAQARAEVDALSERLLSTSKKVQEVTWFSGRSRITNFGEGITATPGKPAKTKKDDYIDPMTASAQALAQAIADIDKAQQTAVKSSLDLSAAEQTLYDLQNSAYWADMPESWKQMAEQRAAAAIETERMTAEQDKLNKIIADLPSVKIEEAWKNVELLSRALDAGKISAAQYDEAVGTLFGNSDKAIEKQKTMAEELGMTFSSAFEDAIVKGEKFSDVLEGIGQDIVRILVRKNITEPLANSLGGLDFGSLFSANALGGVYASPGLSAYSGSIVSKPTVFPFASGIGLMGEAGPEAILPLKRGSNGRLGVEASGSNVQVIVNNNAPNTQATQTTRDDGNGGSIIEVVIEQITGRISSDIARGSGAVPAAMERTYGLNRAAGAY